MQVKARLTQVSASTSMAAARQHTSLVDRPASKGGEDRGPMGGELLLMGVGGCFMSNLLAAGVAKGIALHEAAVDVSAELEGTPARFTTVHLSVSGGTSDRAAMQEMIEIAEAGCIAVNTIKGSATVSVALNTTLS